MLDPKTWTHYTDNLPAGRSVRRAHDCGEGMPLKVTHRTDGTYFAYCHRCHEPGYLAAPPLSLAERLALIRNKSAADTVAMRSVSLPGPMVRDVDDWPDRYKVWFYKAGLSRADVGRLGAYYHKDMDRAVVPVLNAAGAVCFWQARSLDKSVPKYLAPDMGLAGKGAVIPKFRPAGPSDSITLTEDLLSAYKIGKVSEAWCMLGTAPSTHLIDGLLRRKVKVNVWLDPDAAGQRASKIVVNQLRAYGLEVLWIKSTMDPKMHSLVEIRQQHEPRHHHPAGPP